MVRTLPGEDSPLPPPPPPSVGEGAAIDWAALEAALARLPPELRDPAFDPLRYALRVLGRPDAEAALAEVRIR